MEILNGIREHEQKSVLDVEKTSENSQMTSFTEETTEVDQPKPWTLNAEVGWQPVPESEEACPLIVTQAFQTFGTGVWVGGGVSTGGSVVGCVNIVEQGVNHGGGGG